MRAISLWEPWASAIAVGLKKVETRHWKTAVRGRIAIHAAQTRCGVDLLRDSPLRPYFGPHGIREAKDLAFGCIVATATLHECEHTSDVRHRLSECELAFGNYADGRFAWMLRDVQRLPVPVPFRGAQGFFEVPDGLFPA